MTDLTLTRAEIARYCCVRVPAIRQSHSREWRGPCPIHQGKRDSFAIDSETGRWFCHSECARGGDLFDLEKELTGADFPAAKSALFDLVGREDPPRRGGAAGGNGRVLGPIVAEYRYTSEEGDVLFRVTRHDPKDFRQWRPNGGGGWIPGLGKIRRVLYHLPEVIESPVVFIVEGEKDVESLRSFGFVATCCPMGAGKWRAEYNEFFRGRTAIIIPDGDEPGRKHAGDVLRGLKGIAANRFLVELDGAKDISEWFERGHSEVELCNLLETAWEQVATNG